MPRKSVAKREAELSLELEHSSGMPLVRDPDVERIRAARMSPAVERGSRQVAQLVRVAAELRRIVIEIDAGQLNTTATNRIRFNDARLAADDLAELLGGDVDTLREHERSVRA